MLVNKDGIINKKLLYSRCWDTIKNDYLPKHKLSSKDFNDKYKRTFDLRFSELWDWYNKNPHNRDIRLGDLGNLADLVYGKDIKYSVWIDQYWFNGT